MPRDPAIREEERLRAARIDARINAIKHHLGTMQVRCYVCGQTFTTYQGSITIPPNPLEITRLEDVRPVAICSRPYCMQLEQMRQDALVQSILAPQREAYHQRRIEEREAAKHKEKN